MGLWKAVLSGGGEPMVEREFCADFFRRVASPDLEELELITAAHFATSEYETRRGLEPLVEAWMSRPDHERVKFRIRVSLDWFHAEKIGVAPAANAIRAVDTGGLGEADIYIRSVLLSGDDTTGALAKTLGAQRNPIDDYREELLLSSGRTVVVYYKNLILDGRITPGRLEKMPVGLPSESRVDAFGKRFERPDGRQIPARTYNGPEVKHLDGLACLVEDDGRIRILEGNDISRSPYVASVDSWHQAIHEIYKDPLSIFLVEEGPAELAVLMKEHYADSASLETDTNQLYHLAEMLLSTADRRLTAMLLVLAKHLDEGIVSLPDLGLIDEAWNALAACSGHSRKS
jgi:hypothetical protein